MTLSQRDAADSVRWPSDGMLWLGRVDRERTHLLRYREYVDRCATVEWVTMGGDDGDE